LNQKSYPNYKDSEIDWVAQIPAHWGRSHLKLLSQIYSGGTPDKSKEEYWENGTIPWLNSGAVNDFDIKAPSAFITVDALNNSSAKWINEGAVLMALAGQGKTKGMVGQLQFKATCNQSMCAILPREKLNSRYLLWWLNANYQNIRNLAGGDLRDGLNLEMVGSIKVPLPLISEQVEIADFLDRETVKINELIKRQEKLIKYSEERRKSIISHAITKGLDSHAKMKASSFDWLGEYPAHWSFKRLKYSISINPSVSEISDTPGEKLIPFFPMEAIGDDGSLLREFERPFSEIAGAYTYFRNGDVVIAKVTPCFENGKGALIHDLEPGFGFGTTELVVLRPGINLNKEFLYYISISQEIRLGGAAYMTGAGGLKRVPDSFYADLMWPLPPMQEQLAIVNYLDEELSKADLLIKKATQSIELLREYRSSIILSAVSGKIDVRPS
jgi:type I restriction enzyme, S subunit